MDGAALACARRRKEATNPETLSQKCGLLFLAPSVFCPVPPSVGFVMKVVSDESGFLMKMVLMKVVFTLGADGPTFKL